MRRIETSVEPRLVTEGAGVKLWRSIGGRALDHLDPFLLFDDFSSDDPADYRAGFPMHPHRGIETVTYVLDGLVRHADTLGNAGSITSGDVQWMTSGRGIMHEEMPEPREGRMVGFQLWVNLPARLKMTRPRYQEVPAETIPSTSTSDGAVVRVVAGEEGGVRGPVSEIAVEPTYLDVTLPPRAAYSRSIEPDHSAFVYLFEGEVELGPQSALQRVAARRLVVLGPGDRVEARGGSTPSRFLLVSGRALREPIARYGPFVMNTADEIEQALADLRRGTFVS